MIRRKLLLIAVAAILVTLSAGAGTITFDFESVVVGARSSLSVTVDGLTATITRADDNLFAVSDLSSVLADWSPPADWGRRSLDNFYSVYDEAGLIVTFSAPVVGAAISFGDKGGDDDSPVVMKGFGLGALRRRWR